ncbi:alginate O-acetyltransferase AlgX-related protein [Amycolatopsis dongchuanensis]|uniref:AlgX/AlgJ SGNH hydrolase-like domain-containing protein n=1 Tax=Amycolatopsis dongchuanensis TaxID=1070866 RepID=A0ABP9Q8G9_9PSEU
MTTHDDRQSPLPVHEAWLPREHPLYRPRHGRKQVIALVCAGLFFLSPLLTFAAGARVTEFENRALTAFPSLAQGWGFFTQLNPWATDHLVFREDAIHAADGISRSVFGEPPPQDTTGSADTIPLDPSHQAPPPAEFPRVLEGNDGWMYLGDEISSHCEPVQPLDTTFAQLDRLRAGIEATGRKFVVVVAPDKATVVPDHLPDDYAGKDCHQAGIQDFWRRIDQVDYTVDLRAGLRDWGAQLGKPVYGPLDAHWSDEGGVLMARALAEKLRHGISTTWRVEPGQPWTQPADLPPLIGKSGETTGRSYQVLPDGERNQVHPTSTDFSTPLHLNTTSGPGTYGLGVGLLSDSFTIRALPYLAAAFGDLTVLHHNAVEADQGRLAGQVLKQKSVVVLEVAERSLARGTVPVLSPAVVDNILKGLAP